MISIFVRIFLTFLIIDKRVAVPRVSFIDIESIFLWKNLTLNDGILYCLMEKDLGDMSRRRVDEILIEVKMLSEEYNTYTSNLEKRQVERWKLIMDQRQKNEYFLFIKSQLSIFINIIDYMHEEIINFGNSKQSFYENLTTSTQFLTQYMMKQSNTLDQIYRIIFPTSIPIGSKFFQLILVDAERNVPYQCDQFTSAQQFVYFTYIILIITEMKGFSTLIYISSLLKHITNKNKYITEIEVAEKKFTKRVTNYYEQMYKTMISIPREIHRCEVNPSKRGEDYLELINYHQVRLFNAGALGRNSKNKEVYCNYGCEYIDHSVMEKILEIKIHDCQTLGMVQDIQSCPAESGSSRKYLWWRKFQNIYGHYEKCSTAIQIGNGDIPYSERCFLCHCAVISENNRMNKNAILNISVTSQVSDMKHNMIVVGIRFVIHKNVLHLQIQQNKFVLNKINKSSSVWKSLDDYRSTPRVSEIHSEMLSSFSGQLYLDDVMLPPKYAVTGIRFLTRHNHPEGFYLQVQGTPFDLETGQLIPEDSTWFIAHSDLSANSDYHRDRYQLNTENLDDPTRCGEYNYDRTTNNYIRFYHSCVLKDGGQSTVPFIDAQPAETYPPFPLGGIGLFYRNKDECGGYITPRIFTIDISRYN